MDEVEKVKGAIIKSHDINKYRPASLALRDAALLLSYCYKNYDEICELDDDLDKLFAEIISNFFMKRIW
jgi:hypothetical protein